jgi:D-lactate dehydrogenase
MAIITLYDTDATDKQRFTELLSGSGHEFELLNEQVSLKNSNSEAEVISIFVTDNVTREIIDSMPKLKLIATRSTGFDHIDLEAAREKGIVVTNVPRYGEQTVAEFTFALLLALSRKIIPARASILEGNVDMAELVGFDLQGKTIGIVGTGRIGQHAITIAKGFGMHVIAYDLYPNQKAGDDLGFTYVTLKELAEQSDIISLHAPATTETHHLVDSAFLASVKSRAVLVNTARGELVDTTALVQALSANKLAGVALDVLEHEELLRIKASDIHEKISPDLAQAIVDIAALKSMENAILTPHVAFNTHEAVDRIRQTTVQNIIDFYKGETPNKVRA